jgi:hypothetical protein
MHHYLTTTSTSIHDIGDEARWKTVVPSQALSHGFLLHALLGVSALHMNHLRGATDAKNQYLTHAKAHHEEAYMLFRSTVTEITKENCTAAITFSCLMLIFSCGMAQTFDTSNPEETVDGILTILASFRCHWRLFISAKQWIESGPLRGFPPFRTSESPTTGDDAAMKALRKLLAFNTAFTEDEKEKAVYHETIVHLQRPLYGSIAFSRALWLVFTSDEYLKLLEQKRPMALVILAHGSGISKYGPVRWFASDLHLNMTCAIAKVLDPEVSDNVFALPSSQSFVLRTFRKQFLKRAITNPLFQWRPRMRWPLEEWGLMYDEVGNCIPDQSRP